METLEKNKLYFVKKSVFRFKLYVIRLQKDPSLTLQNITCEVQRQVSQLLNSYCLRLHYKSHRLDRSHASTLTCTKHLLTSTDITTQVSDSEHSKVTGCPGKKV